MEIPRCLRARSEAEHGMVCRAVEPLYDGAYQGVRPLSWRRGGGERDGYVLGAEPAVALRTRLQGGGDGNGRVGQAEKRSSGEVQTL